MGTKCSPCKDDSQDWAYSSTNNVCECTPRASAGKDLRLWGNSHQRNKASVDMLICSLFPSSTSHPSLLFCARATQAFLQEEEGASPERPDCEGDTHRGISALLQREGAGRVSRHHHQGKPGPEEEVVPWALALLHPGIRSHYRDRGTGISQWSKELFAPEPGSGVQSLSLELCLSCLKASMAQMCPFSA